MKQSDTITDELFIRLGYLFYSIAIADGTIEGAEINKLKKTIKERWHPIGESLDEFGSPACFKIISVFDWLESKQVFADEAFNKFETFFQKNRHLVDATMRTNILQTAIDISLAFKGENKMEHVFIENLKKMLILRQH